MKEITILPSKNCKRSQKILSYLREHNIHFQEISPETPEGQQLQDQYQLRASPGIIVDQASINPYQILIRRECRVDEEKALELFSEVSQT
jgi:arsenate reductase-like glutaredoxin family protein